MKKAFAMKWADALESGEYKQTKNYLFDGEGYCCLGVACVLAGAKFEKIRLDSTNKELFVVKGTKEAKCIPSKILKKIEMKQQNGALNNSANFEINERIYGCLAEANDDGKKFKSIAKFIRKNYKDF